jgi:tetratricopeptide (TPR) repeat protein
MLREKQTAYALIAVSILVLSGGIYWLVVPMMTTKNETTTALKDCYRGLELINDGNSAQAIAPLEQAVKLLPAYKDGAFYASTAHNRRGAQIDSRPALALAEFDKSIFYDPTNQKPIVNSATMIRLLGKNPDRAADRLEFANSALANKDYKAAIVEYEAALACNDVGSLNAQKQKEIKQLLADVYKQASERPNSEAMPQFVYAWANLFYKINAEIAEAQDPALQQKKLAEKYLSQGVAHSTTGDDAAAEKEYKDALKAQESYPHTPTYTKTLNAIGGFYLNRKNYTQAETYFKQAMHEGEADPLLGVFNLSESYRLYGNMLNQTGQSKMAKQHLEKSDNTLHQMRATIQDYDLAIKIDPNNASNYFLQAMLLRQGSDWKAELTDYDKAINLNPHYAYALTDRACLLHWKKRDQEALSDLNQAIESDPNFNPALRTRGQFYRDHEKWTLAKADLDRALALVKDDEDSLLTRGLVDVNSAKNRRH